MKMAEAKMATPSVYQAAVSYIPTGLHASTGFTHR